MDLWRVSCCTPRIYRNQRRSSIFGYELFGLAAYEWAWADGEPFVQRYELNKSRALLEQLGAEIPNLPPYDSAKDEKLPWEDAVVAAIEELRAEKAAEAAKKAAEPEPPPAP